MSADVELRGVHRSYGRPGGDVHALRGVDLTLPAGQFAAIVGRSGSGKSTLLNLVGGLDRPQSGQVLIGGSDLGQCSEDQLARHRRETVGMIFQSFNLIPSMSARDNVALPLMFAGVRRRDREARATELLERVGLAQRTSHRPVELSGGEQQRVAIGRALVHRPPLLLADEPTGNLDSQTAEEILALIGELNTADGLTVLMVTHDAEAAARHAGRTVSLGDGQVISDAA